ncbi:hypothetical protein CPC08DRAFT_751538 [Agrocybe pediades]|nr:hypothetical protein CPC08DRAFT_751538 [Agrocybe pediades]
MFDSKVKPGQLHAPYFYLTPYASHLTDLSACLRRIMESNAPETSMAAAYHCFLRVSLSMKDSIDTVLDPTDSLAYDYLSILMNNGMDHPLSGCLDTVGMRQSLYSTALLYQTLADFVSIPGYSVWVDHRLELQIRLKRWMYSDHRKLQSSVLVRSVPLPDCIRVRLGSLIATNLAADAPLCLSGRFIILPSTPKELISECCTIYVAFFTCISRGDQYRDWTTSIHMTPEVTEMLTEAACIGYHNLLAPTSIAIADIITTCLQTHLDVLASERDGDHPTYNLLFYAASIYLSAFPKTIPVSWTPSIWSVYEKLEEARMVLVQYKATVLDVVGPDHTIERQFTEYFNSSLYFVDTSQLPRRFTAEWWRFLEEPFLYRAGEEVRIGTGEDGMPITTTFIAPGLPSTS